MAGVLLPDGVVQLGSDKILFPGGVVQITSGATAYTVTAEAGSYTYTGQAATLSRSYFIDAVAGSYVYSGQDATLTTTGSPPVSVTPVSVGVGGKQARKSRSKRERILVYDEVEEEVEEILAEVDKVVRKEPKKKADTPAVKPDEPVSRETVFDWIGYYEAMIARLRDRQRAQALQARLMVASQMMLAAMQKAEAERMAYEAFLLDEDEVAILLAA